ncbi:MAG: CPBP family intramembrane metalloprotease [Promethearchaeota archaeon]|nr:MAG: CPBP family intramembrane metalloprotease [Candidatus Lokiarchaeota archaeon]
MSDTPPEIYEEIEIRPLRFFPALGIFAIAGGIMIAMYYGLFPRWLGRYGPINGYIFSSIAGLLTILFLSIALYYYKTDKNMPATWENLQIRFNLKKLTWHDWKWIFILFIPTFLLPLGLGMLIQWIIGNFTISIPFPGNYEAQAIVSLMNPTFYQGILLFILIVINVIAEELYFRGYVYPRQEKEHGKWTWVIHSLMWWIIHAHNWFNFPTILFNSLLIPLLWHKTKNTTATIVSHFIGNVTSIVIMYILLLF